jgi:hypothetical protein
MDMKNLSIIILLASMTGPCGPICTGIWMQTEPGDILFKVYPDRASGNGHQ